MKTIHTLKSAYQRYFPPIPPEIQESFREVRAFYLLVVGSILLMYIFTLQQTPALRLPGRLIPFTVLMALHAWLHWCSPRITYTHQWAIPYLVIQGTLAFSIILIADNAGTVYGLYFVLIGETFGIFRRTKLGLTAILIYLILAAISFSLNEGLSAIKHLVLPVAATIFFIYVYVTLFNRQADARQQAQELAQELKEANRCLAEYAVQVEELSIANERQRMARELHDILSQGLAGLILQLEAADAHLAQAQLDARSEKARSIIQQTMGQARATLTDARRAIDNLRKAQIDDLNESIQFEIERFTQATGIPCNLTGYVPADLSPESGEVILRAISEALTNIARHASAHHAWLRVDRRDGELQLEIGDDGRGFDPHQIMSGHFGLLGMQERARLAGGSLEIDSQPGSGTRLLLHIPYPDEEKKNLT